MFQEKVTLDIVNGAWIIKYVVLIDLIIQCLLFYIFPLNQHALIYIMPISYYWEAGTTSLFFILFIYCVLFYG